MDDRLTAQTVELLQQLIRNRCVNDRTVASGQEVRTSDVLRAYLDGSGLDIDVYEPDGAMAGRFHGNDERVDVASLALTTQAWLDTCELFLG